MDLELDVPGLSRTVRRIEGIAERAAHPQPAFEGVADDLRAMQKAQFASGAGWDPNNDSTIRQKKAKGQPARILVATGLTEQSYTRKGAPRSIARITNTQLRFGSSVWYLRFHTKKRPPLRVTEAVQNKAGARILRWIVDGER